MNIEDMTITQLKEKAARCAELEARKMSGSVLVRTYSAGVHFGQLEKQNGQEVTLSNARRIWSWKGANTLHEIALRGVNTKASKVSESVPTITLLQAIEIIPLTDEAAKVLYGAGWS